MNGFRSGGLLACLGSQMRRSSGHIQPTSCIIPRGLRAGDDGACGLSP